MSAFFGSHKDEVITPDTVSRSVAVLGFSRKPTAGHDLIFAGGGDDIVAGGGDADLAFLGSGNDRFIWNPGDGNDIVDGGRGADTLEFNGSAGAETIRVDARHGLAKLTRDVGEIEMTLNSMERIEIAAGSSADRIVVGEIASTDVREVAIDLGIDGAGDGFVDRIQLQGSQQGDAIEVVGEAGSAAVIGLPAMVTIAAAEAADELTVVGLGGADTISAATLASGIVQLTLDGGGGDDTVVGSAGADTLLGGDGNDLVIGGRGEDYVSLGAGNDEFVWNPGDGDDVVDGGTGTDQLTFNGSGAAEIMSIMADASSAVLFRDVGDIRMQNLRVERFEIAAGGGEDAILVNEMTGTDLDEIAIHLEGGSHQGDGSIDEVQLEGSDRAETVTVVGDASELQVSGLSVAVSVTGAESFNDTVVIEAEGGNDVIDASAVLTGAAMLRLSGGAGDDVILGGASDDVLDGDSGDDVLDSGSGMDVTTGGDGDDTFVVGNGDLEITDFISGAGTDDRLDVRSLDVDFDWLLANTSDVGGSAVIDFGEHQVTLTGVSASTLHQDDFLLS